MNTLFQRIPVPMRSWAALFCLFLVGPVCSSAAGGDLPADTSVLDSKPLPWEQKTGDRQTPGPAIATPRDLLDLFGIDASQLASLQDGQPLGPNDEETLIKILYRLPAFPPDAEQKWCDFEPDWESIRQSPDEHRAQMFFLKGQATSVEQVQLLPEVADRFEFRSYYRVTLDIQDSPHAAVVCTRAIPAAWPAGVEMREPCRFPGIFLKTGTSDANEPHLVFAANRVAWYPNQANPDRGILADHVFLAKLGMDIGLFDQIRDLSRRPLGVQDGECFYQLLAAVGNATPDEMHRHSGRHIQLEKILGPAATEHGKLAVVQGLARRVTRVAISDEELSQRLGFDHYFQIDVFIPLQDKIVRLGSATSDADAPTFTNTFPVTTCVRHLPSGLTEGADIRREIRIPAAYYRLWAYHSEFVSSYDDRQMQVAPMFIGLAPEIVQQESRSNPYVGLGAGLVVLAAMGATWYGLWRWNRSDQPVSFRMPRQAITLAPEREPPESAE